MGLSNAKATPEAPRYTFSGIGVYRPEMFASVPAGSSAKLVTLLRYYADRGQLGGEVTNCAWTDVGTPQRLAELNQLRRN